jgi:magnesium transporter
MAARVTKDHLDEPVTDHMRRDFVRLRLGETIGEALFRIQHSGGGGRIVYFYVVDDEDRLCGVIPTRRLLLNPPQTPVRAIMETHVTTLPATATLLDACDFFMLHRLLALPVVNDEGRILGVIDVELYTDEISDVARWQESEDLFQLIGVRLAQVRQASVPVAFRARFPWLLCNIGGGLACAALAAVFENVLGQVIVLAMFIPIVLALAESVSIQSLTLAIQAHHAGPFRWGAALRVLGREASIGAMLGVACGGLVGAASLVWKPAAMVAVVLVVSIGLSVTTAAALGLAVPFGLRAIRRDPKVASGPITLATTDIATLIYYLGLATLLLL